MPNTRLGTAEVLVTLDDRPATRDVSRLSQAIDVGLTRSLSRLGQIGTAVQAVMAPLSVQTAQLASSLVSAAGAAGTAVPLLTSLGQGVGVLRIGFQGLEDAITDGGDALSSLPPQTEAVATAIRGLEDEWDSLTATVQEGLFEGVADDINTLASTYLPLLESRLTETAGVINDFGESFTTWATSGSVVQELNGILGSQTGILEDLLDAALPVADGLLDIFVPTIPFAETLARNIESLAQEFADWAAEARASGTITDFFERATENASQFLEIIINLGSGVSAFFEAGQASSATLLESLVQTTEQFQTFAESAQGQEQFRQFFEFIATYSSQVRDVLGDVVSIFGNLAQVGFSSLEVFLNIVESITSIIAAVAGPLAAAFNALPGPLGEVVVSMLAIQRLGIGTIFAQATTLVTRFGDALSSSSTATNAQVVNFGRLETGARLASRAVGALRGALAVAWPIAVVAAVVTAIDAIRTSLDNASISADEAAQAIADIRTGVQVDDLVGPWEEYQNVIEETNNVLETFEGTSAINSFMAINTAETQALHANEEYRESIQALDDELSSLIRSGDGAAFGEVLEGIGEQLGLSGDALDQFANEFLPSASEAFDDAAQSILDFSRQTDVSIDEFERMQEALGLTDAELRRLAREGGPEYVEALRTINEAQRLGLDSTGQINSELVTLAAQLGVTGEGAQEFATETISAWQDIVQGLDPVGQAVSDTLQASEDAVAAFAESFAEAFELDTSDVEAALSAGEQAFLDFATANGVSAETAAQAWADYSTNASFSVETFIQQLQEEAAAQANFIENMALAARLGGEAFAQELAARGPEALQGFADANVEQQQLIIDSISGIMTAGAEGASAALQLGLSELPVFAGDTGRQALLNLLTEINNPEELIAATEQLNTLVSLGFADLATSAQIYGQATAEGLLSNLRTLAPLSAEQIALLNAGTQAGLIDWNAIVTTQGTAFAATLSQKVSEGRTLTAGELAILRANTSTDMAAWAAIATVQGEQWRANLDAKLAAGQIDFATYSAALEALALGTDADVETEVIPPPPGQAAGIYQGIANALAKPVGVGTVLERPNVGAFIASLFIPTVTIPTQLGQPGYGVLANAHGGIYDKPAFTTIAEAYQKEVVIPLERPQRAQQLAELSGLFDVVSDPRARQVAAAGQLSIDIGDVVINALASQSLDLQEQTLQQSLDFATEQFNLLSLILADMIVRFTQLNLTSTNLVSQMAIIQSRVIPLDLVFTQLRGITIDFMRYIGIVRARLIELNEVMLTAINAVSGFATDASTFNVPDSTQQSGLQQAAQELLNHILSGGSFYEDFSFSGDSALLSQLNDQLADLFYSANPGFDFGPSGTAQAIIDWLQEFLGRASGRSGFSAQGTQAQRVIQIAEGAIVVQTQIADPEEVAEQVMDRFAALAS